MTQLISATVPALFSMSFSADPVVLTPGAPDGGNLPFAGVINDVTVTDTRAGGNAWVLSGRVSDLSGPTGTLPGSAGYLGWDPALRPGAPSGVTAGPAVASSLASPGGPGLAAATRLASGATGHGVGLATAGAAVDLRLPQGLLGGTYTTILTLTAI